MRRPAGCQAGAGTGRVHTAPDDVPQRSLTKKISNKFWNDQLVNIDSFENFDPDLDQSRESRVGS